MGWRRDTMTGEMVYDPMVPEGMAMPPYAGTGSGMPSGFVSPPNPYGSSPPAGAPMYSGAAPVPTAPGQTSAQPATARPSFGERLRGPMGRRLSSGLMALGQGLLEASGPSPYPVSFGQALGRGIGLTRDALAYEDERAYEMEQREADLAVAARRREGLEKVQQLLAKPDVTQDDIAAARSFMAATDPKMALQALADVEKGLQRKAQITALGGSSGMPDPRRPGYITKRTAQLIQDGDFSPKDARAIAADEMAEAESRAGTLGWVEVTAPTGEKVRVLERTPAALGAYSPIGGGVGSARPTGPAGPAGRVVAPAEWAAAPTATELGTIKKQRDATVNKFTGPEGVQTKAKLFFEAAKRGDNNVAKNYLVKYLEQANEPGAIVRPDDYRAIDQLRSMLSRAQARFKAVTDGFQPVDDKVIAEMAELMSDVYRVAAESQRRFEDDLRVSLEPRAGYSQWGGQIFTRPTWVDTQFENELPGRVSEIRSRLPAQGMAGPGIDPREVEVRPAQ